MLWGLGIWRHPRPQRGDVPLHSHLISLLDESVYTLTFFDRMCEAHADVKIIVRLQTFSAETQSILSGETP